MPLVTITFMKETICLPAPAYSLTRTLLCYFPFVQFLSASTLGLIYNKQSTGISFTMFPLKFYFLFKTFCFPSPNIWTECKRKYQVILSKTLKNEPPCVNSMLCFYILQSHHLFGELTYYSVFLPIFYLLCR